MDQGGRLQGVPLTFALHDALGEAVQLLVDDLQESVGRRIEPYPDRVSGIRAALVMGVRDYIAKCGFGSVVIGLSDGVDSAVTAAIAVDAVVASNVRGVAMPKQVSPPMVITNATTISAKMMHSAK